jgi:hypothetical protein
LVNQNLADDMLEIKTPVHLSEGWKIKEGVGLEE